MEVVKSLGMTFVSHAYKRVGSITALSTFSLVRSLPKPRLPVAVIEVTSSLMCIALERVPPR